MFLVHSQARFGDHYERGFDTQIQANDSRAQDVSSRASRAADWVASSGRFPQVLGRDVHVRAHRAELESTTLQLVGD